MTPSPSLPILELPNQGNTSKLEYPSTAALIAGRTTPALRVQAYRTFDLHLLPLVFKVAAGGELSAVLFDRQGMDTCVTDFLGYAHLGRCPSMVLCEEVDLICFAWWSFRRCCVAKGCCAASCGGRCDGEL